MRSVSSTILSRAKISSWSSDCSACSDCVSASSASSFLLRLHPVNASDAASRMRMRLRMEVPGVEGVGVLLRALGYFLGVSGRKSVEDHVESFGEEDFWVDVVAECERLLDPVHEEFEDEGGDGGVEVADFALFDPHFHLFGDDLQVDFVRLDDAFADFGVTDAFFCEDDEEASVVFVGSEVREEFKGELLEFTERRGF